MTKEAQKGVRLANDCPAPPRRIAAQRDRTDDVAVESGSGQFPLKIAALLVICMLLTGCGVRNSNVGPSIEFTRIPLAGHGGPDRLDTIEGRVVQARPGQQIVLYARWGPWWVQPLADQPFTKIQPDSTWRSSTHFGTEYAAELVEPGYQPQPTMEVLPSVGAGVIVVAVTKGRAVFWQTGWFMLGSAAAFGLTVVMLFRLRMQQVKRQHALLLEERLAERTRIAQVLHDTLLQDFLSVSMQLHLVNDQLAGDSSVKPIVTRILELIGRVIEESRNTVNGLRSSSWRSQDLEQAFSRIQEELAVSQKASFCVIVEGVARPLQPAIGDDVYLIGREALANAFHHAGASKIELELEYLDDELRVVVRDNGCGFAGHVLQSKDNRERGLFRMRERAERIGAKLRVLSRATAGTEIELTLPGHKAYLPRDSDRPASWLSSVYLQRAKGTDSTFESEGVR